MSTLLQSLFFIPHYNPAFPAEVSPILVPGWTLNYEMFFYMVFAFSLWHPRSILVVSVLMVGLVIVGALVPFENAVAKTFTHNPILEFVAGLWLAKIYLSGRFASASRITGLGVFGLGVIIAVAFPDVAAFENERILRRGVPATLIITGVLIIEANKATPSSAFGLLIGNSSYCIYLTHILAMGVLREIWQRTWDISPSILEAWFFLCSALVFSTTCGIACYWLVERLIERWLKKMVAIRRS